MRKSKNQASIDKPKKGYRTPFLLLTLCVFGVSLLFITMSSSQTALSVRNAFNDSYYGFIEDVDAFGAGSKDMLQAVSHFMQREKDIEKLKDDNRELMKWRHIAQKLYAENDSLKKHLQFVPEERHDFVTARVLSSSQDVYKVALLNVGLQNDVHKGDAVLGQKGVVGRVIEVTQKTAKVLMLDDPLSRVPVKVEGKPISAMVAGDYSGKLRLLYVAHDSPLTVGDRLLTSNEGGIFPDNFFVGTVASLKDEEILVTPPESLAAMDFMMVLREGEREEVVP